MELDYLLDDAKMKAPSEAVFDLIKAFEQFASSIVKLADMQDNGGDFQSYMKEMGQLHERLQNQFARVAASYGMTIEQFCEHLENPANFDPENWVEIQSIKEKIAGTLNLSEDAQKTQKINKNIKI